MTDNAIELINVSKRYLLGEHLRTGRSLRETVAGLVHRRGAPPRSDEVWSLRDVTLAIAEGDAVGIIGRNGAGKSTLLKIITRITEPTTGVSRTRGRVGALLEVGTGFHPELTGRENVFLNGAVLGMPRQRVQRQFDEIVYFAGIERFIDTPIKRYSSGMYLRLAFAVAAHLDSEILAVDEVLAVGDAEFQRKCLGKMADVERSGRTVLFVSHNLDAILRLCPQVIGLEQGSVSAIGRSADVLDAYLASGLQRHGVATFADTGGVVSLRSISLLDAQGRLATILPRDEPFTIRLCFSAREAVPGLDLSAIVTNLRGLRMLDEAWSDSNHTKDVGPGTYTAELTIPPVLNVGEYSLSIWMGSAYDDYVWEDSPVTFRLDGETKNRDERLLQLSLGWNVLPGAPSDLPAGPELR
jgi:ABC-2 type transport system ATP-binding protein/lipopolysaccharide transport system ATP-binding protein